MTETVEQESKRIEQEMRLAAASGDIGSVVRLITETSSQKPADFIKKTVGSILFMYYSYVDKLHVRPLDLDDFIDGILYVEAREYCNEKARQKAEKAATKR